MHFECDKSREGVQLILTFFMMRVVVVMMLCKTGYDICYDGLYHSCCYVCIKAQIHVKQFMVASGVLDLGAPGAEAATRPPVTRHPLTRSLVNPLTNLFTRQPFTLSDDVGGSGAACRVWELQPQGYEDA